MLFGELTIWYLFFGGLSGGAYLVWFALCVLARLKPDRWLALQRATTRPMLVISLAALLVGCVCLVQDLTLPDRLLLLFMKPTTSLLSVGAFTLGALIIALVYLTIESFRSETLRSSSQKYASRKTRFVQIIAIIAAVLALVAIVYTGVFLSSMTTVPFWTTPLVPILFFLSSCSTGVAVLLLTSLLSSLSAQKRSKTLRVFLFVDMVLVILEAGALIGMYLVFSADPVTQLSLTELIQGVFVYEFWLGLIVCMILIPLVMELFMLITRAKSVSFYAILGCSILIGGYFLRYCVVNAGVHLSSLMYMSVGVS